MHHARETKGTVPTKEATMDKWGTEIQESLEKTTVATVIAVIPKVVIEMRIGRTELDETAETTELLETAENLNERRLVRNPSTETREMIMAEVEVPGIGMMRGAVAGITTHMTTRETVETQGIHGTIELHETHVPLVPHCRHRQHHLPHSPPLLPQEEVTSVPVMTAKVVERNVGNFDCMVVSL